MALNYLMLFLVTIGGVGTVIYNIRKTMNNASEIDEYQNDCTIQSLVDYVKEQIAAYMNVDFQETNLNQQEYMMLTDQRNEFRTKLKEAAQGNVDAKEYIKASINDMLQRNKKITEKNIDSFIRFNNIEELSSVDMTEILIYAFSQYCENNTIPKYPSAKEGLAYMIDKYDLTRLHEDDTKTATGEMIYDISAKMIKEIYLQESENDGVLANLDFTDKMNIITQRVFEQYKGFGPIDLLLDSSVDEIDCGVSGVPAGSFDVDKSQMDKVVYSYESIWIMYHGLNVKFSALKFASQAELIRVAQNIYRYDAPTVLSRKEGRVVSTMKDGSRVVVVRPPFADSYAFFVRKFNAEVARSPEDLFKIEGSENIHKLMKWLIRGHRNIMFTGSQGTGKTTTMKAYFKYVPVDYNVRVQELTAELNLRYLYPNRNIASFQETADIPTQVGLDTQKKTNGAVNIIGEVATAEAACWIIQTAKVASLFTWGSHHAKTAKDLVTAIRDNLLTLGIFSDAIAAEAAVADVINIDVHMEKREKERYLERITEIIPIKDHSYPSDHIEASLKDKYMMDMRESQRRQTDRTQFEVQNLLEYQNGKYVLTNMPTDTMIAEMRSKILPSQVEEFDKDMEDIRKAVEEYKRSQQPA